jgi:hypothetical protein
MRETPARLPRHRGRTASAPPSQPQATPCRVEQRDHQHGAQIVDHRDREQEQADRGRHATPDQGEHAHGKGDVGGRRNRPAAREAGMALREGEKTSAGVAMPASAASTGKRRRRGSASAPWRISRLISSPRRRRTAPSARR